MDLYSTEEDDVVEYLIIDTMRRTIEIVRMMTIDPDLSIARIISSLNRFDHEDECYLCDWHKGHLLRTILTIHKVSLRIDFYIISYHGI